MNRFKLNTLLILGVFLSPLNADYILEYKMDEEVQKILYHDAATAKIITSQENSAIYKIGQKTYIVTNNTIIDADEMGKLVNAYAPPNEELKEKVSYKIEKTGKKVKVAGITGEIWIITGEADGEPYKKEVAVTKDERVVKVFEVMNSMLSRMSGRDTTEIFEITDGYVPLKVEGMVLQSFSDTKVPSSEYILPKTAKKQNLPSPELLQGMFNSYTQESSEDEEDNSVDLEQAENLLKSFF